MLREHAPEEFQAVRHKFKKMSKKIQEQIKMACSNQSCVTHSTDCRHLLVTYCVPGTRDRGWRK